MSQLLSSKCSSEKASQNCLKKYILKYISQLYNCACLTPQLFKNEMDATFTQGYILQTIATFTEWVAHKSPPT